MKFPTLWPKKYHCVIEEEQLDDERNLQKLCRNKLGSPAIKILPQTLGFNNCPRNLVVLARHLGQQGLKKIAYNK
jgi:hypothetical protein